MTTNKMKSVTGSMGIIKFLFSYDLTFLTSLNMSKVFLNRFHLFFGEFAVGTSALKSLIKKRRVRYHEFTTFEKNQFEKICFTLQNLEQFLRGNS